MSLRLRAQAPLALVAAAFFVSGAAGLVYQVAWQRILALHSGVGIYSIAMIVAAFMAGLGIGSHLGGRLSTRTTPGRALALFGGLEAAIGVFGALSAWIYYDLLYLRAGWLYAPAWRAGVLHFLGLLLPTTLMGMTLPFLVRAMVREVGTAGRTIGSLYGVNLAGAAAGALAAPWFLIPGGGIRGAVLAAALGNATAAVAALALARWTVGASPASSPSTPGPDPAGPEPRRHPFGLWVALYAASGFVALSLEIVWFRLLDIAVKSTAFTFGTLLSFYLAGSAVGCLAGAFLAQRQKRPLRAFLAIQGLLLAYAGAVVVLLAHLPTGLPFYGWFFRYWSEWMGLTLGGSRELGQILRLYVVLPSLLFGPPTVLMGLSFPILQRAVQDEVRTSGWKVGILQSANIAGCVAGSLVVGLLSLTWLGSTGTLRALLLVGIAFALVGFRVEGDRSTFGALGVLLLALALILPDQDLLFRRLHGTASETALVDEDATAVGTMVPSGPGRWAVFINGKAHSWIPFGGVHSQLGAIPALIHPAPREVAIVGLGSGDTAWAAACRPETRSVTVFEISGPQPRLLRRLAVREGIPDLRKFLDDPRLTIRIADGRNALAHDDRKYDLIEADALWPQVASSGNLYSIEFFQECSRRLKPQGIMCTWAPTPRVFASFSKVFPHVLKSYNRAIVVGSAEPLPVETALWLERLESPAVQAYLGSQVAPTIRGVLAGMAPPHKRQRYRDRDYNRDLDPRDEFLVP